MQSKKIALLTVAIVAVGIFALPGTVSLFSGQHSWYYLGDGANEVPCEKCHGEIEDEMQSGENGAHRNLTCAMCHRTMFNNYTYGSGEGDASTPGKEAHAAAVVQCMDCHGVDETGQYNHGAAPEYEDCYACHINGNYYDDEDFIVAGGFNLSGRSWDTGKKAAHRKFVNDSIDEPLMEGANEACIACHTRIGVNITWTKKEYLEFTAFENETGWWTLTKFAAGGKNVTQVNSSNEWTNP